MSVEIELKKLLLDNGFVTKKTKKGSEWTLTHEKYLVVNYHTSSRDISFNYLGKYMRDDVIKTHGTIIGLQPEKKERLYRKALSNLSNSHFAPKRALLNGIEGFLGSIGGCVTHSCSAFSARRSQATCFWGPLGSFRAH